jgi:hypothetical protein
MMIKLKNIYMFVLIAGITFLGCQDEDFSIGDIIAPSNVIITTEVVGVDTENPFGDGSGFVNFKATADNVISFKFSFGDGITQIVPTGEVSKRYTAVGVNTFDVVVTAIGAGGLQTTATTQVEVFSSFDDPEAKQLLTGGEGSSKTWYWAAAEPEHLGVGGIVDISPDSYWFPAFFAAQPFQFAANEASACFYEDEFTFSMDANGQVTYVYNNNGGTFFNVANQDIVGGSVGEDRCFEFDTSGTSIVSLFPSDQNLPEGETTGTVMNLSNNNFMGYYVGTSDYEILEISDNFLRVRTLDVGNPVLAWYHIFTTSPPDAGFDTIYNDLVFEDNFDTAGAPNPAIWTYDLGNGVNGWGNNEVQNYTNNSENVMVEDGLLKITALRDGSNFTSARIKSEGLYEFTYGRVEVRAKLPEGGGTWPAIWMLGADYQTNIWPACGEIDIMEHVGNNPNTVLGTLHYPGVSPGAGNSASTFVPNATTEFHNYIVEWRPDGIFFLVDDTVYHSFVNNASTPFNSDFFFILNIAMGGSLGGDIDPAFTSGTMEIDYVRLYQ